MLSALSSCPELLSPWLSPGLRIFLQDKGQGAFSTRILHPLLVCFPEPFPAELLTFPFLQAPWGRPPSPSKKDKSQ